MPDRAAPRVLVVGPSWVGDMIMAQSLFMALRSAHPGMFLGVLAPGWTAPLLARMPEVDLAIGADFRHGRFGLTERLRQARDLRRHRFDRAVILPRSLKSALAPWLARIPVRTGYLGEQRYGLVNDIRPLDKRRLPLTVQRFVWLASTRGENASGSYAPPRLSVDPQRRAAALAELGLGQPASPVLALCPGAEYGPAKRWPARHFAELARRATEHGFAVWLFGSERDRPITAEIREQTGAAVDLAGRTNLGQAIDLMSLAAVVVSNDSGLMHVGAALGRPLVALYGSSSPGFTPPLDPAATVLSLDLECSPCFKRQCPLGHTRCLEELDPERVFEAATRAAGAAQAASLEPAATND